MQGIALHLVIAFGIFKPMPVFHTGIGAIVYFAKVFHLHKKAITTKGKMVQRVINQLLFADDGILFPLTLQVRFAFALVIRVETAGAEARGKKQEARSRKQEAFFELKANS